MAKGEKLIATNPNAKRDYLIEEIVEAGIVLLGTEVKSLRSQSPNIKDAYVDVKLQNKKTEAWLLNAHIGPYSHGNRWNHPPHRERKLLLHRHQLDKLFGALTQKALSIIPIRMYFKNGFVKIELGMGKGKKKKDKRETVKIKEMERQIAQAKKHSR